MALLLLVGRLGAASDEQFVREVLKANCVRCHGEKKAKADVTLHALSIGRMQANEVLSWKKVYEELENGTMPPDQE
jgi:cytochrome c553